MDIIKYFIQLKVLIFIAYMNRLIVYEDRKTWQISFPLGGIGTGCIGLAGNGRLIDWEIFNRPNKGGLNGFSHFAIKAESDGKVVDARILNGDLPPPYNGEFSKPLFQSFGFGPPREYMAGFPHFKKTRFEGSFPIAKIAFEDDNFPGEVEMTAFNPFIPLNDKDSSLPAAFFEFRIHNPTEERIAYTLCLSIKNPLSPGTTINTYGEEADVKFIRLSSSILKEDDLNYGNLTIATDASDVSYQEYWYRGSWFDELAVYWRDFSSPGRFRNRRYDKCKPNVQDHCSLATHFQVNPHEEESIRFIISWFFPNCYNYWNPDEEGKVKTWKNYYATVFKDSTEVAIYGLKNWVRLYGETLEFKEALFSSTFPIFVIDAISANISILKTPTLLRLEDGSLYGFEGCHPSSGCCEGSCMHVWNYAVATAYLFPNLERSMLNLYFKYCQREDGKLSFRLQLPLGRGLWKFPHAAVDGQFGCVIRTYRLWKILGDDLWLKSIWVNIKKAIEYAWAETNEDKWDLNRDGVIEGRQHHTLDMELFGPNSWLTGFYLAALKAGAEMAKYLGEEDKAEEYFKMFIKGREWVDRNLFNGEYYCQLIDLNDRNILERFKQVDEKVVETYWDDEHCEIKYQIGEGCEIDQVVAQWHANISGLGEIFDRSKVRKALEAIYRHNFKEGLRKFVNPCRIFSLNDEAGVVICEWPREKRKPVIPVPYAEETMSGFEYAVSSHMIQEGLVEEGLRIVKAIRDRYDGEKRNPWNEFECGSNYVRSMASYALLLALSGFEYDSVRGYIAFNPRINENGRFRCFWSLGCGWGIFELNTSQVLIQVKYGQLKLRVLKFPFLKGCKIKSVLVDGTTVKFKEENMEIVLDKVYPVYRELVIQFLTKELG
ncbi:MAG: GH116 family glycosyl-hydrolase [Candidatus Bathyarchaeia archaeon]